MRRLKGLASRLPWWLRPWGAYISAHRAFVVAHLNEIQQAKIIRKQDRDIDDLKHEIRRLRLGSGEGMPSTQEPDFVIVGIPRPGMGVRVIASQKLGGVRFDMTPMGEQPEWVIRAQMGQALFADKPTYPEAITHVLTIWQNWAVQTDGPAPGWQARPHGVPQPEDLVGREVRVSIDLSGNYPPKVLPGSPSRGIMQTEPPRAIEQKGSTDDADQGD